MLVAALIRLTFYMDVNPAAIGIAVSGAIRHQTRLGRPRGGGFGFFEVNIRKPSLAVERPAGANAHHDVVLRSGGGESEADRSPIVGAGDGCGMHVKGHRGHGESGADGDGGAPGIADFHAGGAHPGLDLIAMAGDERGGRKVGARGGAIGAGFQAEGFGVIVGNGGVREGLAGGGCGGGGREKGHREEEGQNSGVEAHRKAVFA